MRLPHDQTGSTLIVALLMLTILAILGVNAVTNSTMNLRVVSNMQAQQDAEATGQDAIEQVISTIANFNDPQRVDDLGLPVAPPECLDARPAEGYSAVFALAPEQTLWEVRAAVEDGATGAKARIRQGVTITMRAGSCP
jgi:Tfp pilus assembly protein PilX